MVGRGRRRSDYSKRECENGDIWVKRELREDDEQVEVKA